MRQELPLSNWVHNRLFEEVGAAIEMQQAPSAFWLMEEIDKALVMAHRRASNTIRAYEEHLSSKRDKKGRRKSAATAGRS